METAPVQRQAPRGKGKNNVQLCDFLINCLIHHICGSSIWTCNFCDHYSFSIWNIQIAVLWIEDRKWQVCLSISSEDRGKEKDQKENGHIVVTKWPARPNITGTVISTSEMESLETACETGSKWQEQIWRGLTSLWRTSSLVKIVACSLYGSATCIPPGMFRDPRGHSIPAHTQTVHDCHFYCGELFKILMFLFGLIIQQLICATFKNAYIMHYIVPAIQSNSKRKKMTCFWSTIVIVKHE